MIGSSKTVSSSSRTAPLPNIIALDLLPRRAKVENVGDTVLKNMTLGAAPPYKTPPLTLAATARASTQPA